MSVRWMPNEEICTWLRSKYGYDSGRGVITLLNRGKDARITPSNNRYLQIRLTKTSLGVRRYVSVHRFAWFLHYGSFPAIDVDHRDRDKSNNRIDNLRLANRSHNHMNGPKKVKRNGAFTSRYKGVSWNQKNRRWVAMIGLNGKTKYLGQFMSEVLAAKAYDTAAILYFGEFAATNLNLRSFYGRV